MRLGGTRREGKGKGGGGLSRSQPRLGAHLIPELRGVARGGTWAVPPPHLFPPFLGHPCQPLTPDTPHRCPPWPHSASSRRDGLPAAQRGLRESGGSESSCPQAGPRLRPAARAGTEGIGEVGKGNWALLPPGGLTSEPLEPSAQALRPPWGRTHSRRPHGFCAPIRAPLSHGHCMTRCTPEDVTRCSQTADRGQVAPTLCDLGPTQPISGPRLPLPVYPTRPF